MTKQPPAKKRQPPTRKTTPRQRPKSPKATPTIYMISGCNGAGKSTLVHELIPTILPLRKLINPDDIARGLNPLEPELMGFKAGMLALKQMDEYIEAKESFAFETTAAGIAYAQRLRHAQEIGFRIQIIYIFIESPDLAVERVTYRKKQGGHGVPENDIRRRYYRGLKNIFDIYLPIADSAAFYSSFGQPSAENSVRLHCIAIWDKLKGMLIMSSNDWQILLNRKESE